MANLFTKESIKARMFKQAATLYDIRNIDGIDPLFILPAACPQMVKQSHDPGQDQIKPGGRIGKPGGKKG